MYASEEFAQLAQTVREMADRLGQAAGPGELAAMGKAYLTSLRFEHRFWEMAYTLEDWGA